jgi:hypothetical protein
MVFRKLEHPHLLSVSPTIWLSDCDITHIEEQRRHWRETFHVNHADGIREMAFS